MDRIAGVTSCKTHAIHTTQQTIWTDRRLDCMEVPDFRLYSWIPCLRDMIRVSDESGWNLTPFNQTLILLVGNFSRSPKIPHGMRGNAVSELSSKYRILLSYCLSLVTFYCCNRQIAQFHGCTVRCLIGGFKYQNEVITWPVNLACSNRGD